MSTGILKDHYLCMFFDVLLPHQKRTLHLSVALNKFPAHRIYLASNPNRKQIMNIISATIAAAYLSAGGLAASTAVDFAKDFGGMNQSIMQTLKRGEIDMSQNAAMIKKVCANSAITLSMSGYKNVACDFANGQVTL
jgi:hypothetical protein